MYARLIYDFEVECREQGWGDPAFIYDQERDLFRFTDGRFAFSHDKPTLRFSRREAGSRNRVHACSDRGRCKWACPAAELGMMAHRPAAPRRLASECVR
jgi:hypothetical protein